MKKTMMLLMLMALISTLGTAFAADGRQSADRSDGLYNGITTFDLGPTSSSCQGFSYTAAGVETAKPYNGITVFDLGQPGSGAGKPCANFAADQSRMSKAAFNGITIF